MVINLGVFLKLYKLVITIISLAYFFGIVWFIFCDMHYEIATSSGMHSNIDPEDIDHTKSILDEFLGDPNYFYGNYGLYETKTAKPSRGGMYSGET